MRLFALALAALCIAAAPASAWHAHGCGHVAIVPVAPAGYAPTYAAPAAVCHGMTYAPSVSYAPAMTYAMPYTVGAPSCTGYAPSYAPTYAPSYSYAQPVQITSLSYAVPSAAAPAAAGCTGTALRAVASPTAAGDVNDSIVKLTAAVGQLTKIVSTHTDVLAEHQERLRAIEGRTGALERRTGVAPGLPVPKQ